MRLGREDVRMELCNCLNAVPRMIEFCIRIVVLRDLRQYSLEERYRDSVQPQILNIQCCSLHPSFLFYELTGHIWVLPPRYISRNQMSTMISDSNNHKIFVSCTSDT